jgi:hypothetical protein
VRGFFVARKNKLSFVFAIVKKVFYLCGIMTDTSDKATCQKAAILAHLRQHGSIDSKTSRTLYGCEALRSRIADLRKAGIEIETRYVRFVSMFGHGGRYAEYHLSQSKK